MRDFKRFFSRPVNIILLIIVSLILIYLIMLWNTNSVVEYAKAVFNGEIPRSEIENTPWRSYDTTRYYSDGKPRGADEVEIEIHRIFAIHNFSDGYIWAKYKNFGYDENGRILYCTVMEYPFYSRWKIHKENGEWVLVEIDEHP